MLIYAILVFFVVFHHKIGVFIIFISFFKKSLKFPQQNINQSETRIGGFQLSAELHGVCPQQNINQSET